MPHIAGHPQIGATPVDDGTADPQTFKYDLYTLKQNTPDLGGRKLQDVYGRGSMPSYQWLETIKTGEATYTDTSAADRALLAQAKADYDAAGGASSGLENPMDIIKAELAPVLGQVAEGIGSSLATGGTIYEGLPVTTSGLKIAEGTSQLGDISKLKISTENAGALKGIADQTGEIATADAVMQLIF